jgi:hypothetical protein
MELHQRIVMYKHLFETDHPLSPNLVEYVPVSPAIDGILPAQSFSEFLNLHLNEHLPNYPSPQNLKRINTIRPWACRLPFHPSATTYGMCVDVRMENAYWEGVILDDTNNDIMQSVQRTVFFPDLGIEESILLQNLYQASDWNEVTDEWVPRGMWKFLEALEANKLERAGMCVSVQQLWHIARSDTYFVSRIGAWTCGTRDDWFSLVQKLMQQLNQLTTSTSIQLGTFSKDVSDFVGAYKNRNNARLGTLSKSLKEKSCIAQSHLKSVGWKFMETRRGKKYYVSAEGTRYDSFIKACEGYLSLSGMKSFDSHETTICTVATRGMTRDKVIRGPHEQRCTWSPVNLVPKFSSVLAQGAKYGDVTSDTVRKYLLQLGWTIEYKSDTNRPITRYRYHSPKGKTYYSLKLIFDDFESEFQIKREDSMRLTQEESKLDDIESDSKAPYLNVATPKKIG